jgi:hypothetical protein
MALGVSPRQLGRLFAPQPPIDNKIATVNETQFAI